MRAPAVSMPQHCMCYGVEYDHELVGLVYHNRLSFIWPTLTRRLYTHCHVCDDNPVIHHHISGTVVTISLKAHCSCMICCKRQSTRIEFMHTKFETSFTHMIRHPVTKCFHYGIGSSDLELSPVHYKVFQSVIGSLSLALASYVRYSDLQSRIKDPHPLLKTLVCYEELESVIGSPTLLSGNVVCYWELQFGIQHPNP